MASTADTIITANNIKGQPGASDAGGAMAIAGGVGDTGQAGGAATLTGGAGATSGVGGVATVTAGA